MQSGRNPASWSGAEEDAFPPRQFSNVDNVEAHAVGTGPEIWWQLRFRGLKPDAVVAGVGTGGTNMGVGRFLTQVHPAVKLHPLEPANSPTLSTGRRAGKNRIQGISDEFIPAIVDLHTLDPVVSVDDGDAILMARSLAGALGMGVGISSGANLLGAIKVQQEPVKDGFLTPEIRLEGLRAYKRVCHTCCDPADCVEAMSPRDLEVNEALPHCPRRS